MKQKVSPVAAAIVLVVVIGVAALAWFRLAGGPGGSREGEKPPGMPASAAAEFQKRLGGVTGPTRGAAPAGGMPAGVPTGPGAMAAGAGGGR